MFTKSQKPETKLSQSAGKTPTKPKVPSIISADLHVVGNLKADSDIQIDGIVDGDIETKLLTVGETATVNGSIEGEVIRVAGHPNDFPFDTSIHCGSLTNCQKFGFNIPINNAVNLNIAIGL